jgi:hypothetical protein
LTAAILQAKDASGVSDQNGVDAKVVAVNAAVEAFKIALKASTGLADLISAAQAQLAAAVEGTGAGQYAAGSKATLQAAIDAAITALNAEPVSQAALLAAVSALTVANDNFNAAQNPPVDISGLADVIAEAQQFLNGKPASDYAALRAVLAEAQALLENPAATQDEIDAITDALADALAAAQEPDGIDNVNADGILVYSANGTLKIEGLQSGMSVTVYNALGQIVLSSTANGNYFAQPLEIGFYLVRIKSDFTISRKVLVK